MSITSQVIILFLVALVGAACRKLGYFTDETINCCTKLVLNVTLPILTVYNMQRDFDPQVLVNFAVTIVVTAALVFLLLAVSYLIFLRREPKRRTVLSTMQAFTNCGFMGYPIILAIQPDWMIYAVGYNIGTSLIVWTIGVAMFAGRKGVNLRKVFLNPNIVSAVVGILVFCTSFRFPDILDQVMAHVGGLTTPMSMLLIGTRMIGINLNELRDKDYHIAALLRLLILPLLCRAILGVLPIERCVSDTVFILIAMPAGTMTAMLAELYDCEAVFSARVVAYSTLLSLLSVPIISLLL